MNALTTTSNSTMKCPTLAELSEMMRKLSLEPPTTFLVHPNNMRTVAAHGFPELDITISDLLPERNWKEQWFPPEGDRFCEYGPEDEHWMRPLGLGTVKQIDMGPVMFAMQKRAMDRFAMKVFGDLDL